MQNVLDACETLLGREAMDAIRSRDRDRDTSRYREAVAFACREIPTVSPSLPEIAAALGRLYHSTIYAGIDRFSRLDCREPWIALVRREIDGVAIPPEQSSAVVWCMLREGRREHAR